jgi:hypothetical protein
VYHTFRSSFSFGFWLLSLSPYLAAGILHFVFHKTHAATGALILTAAMDVGACYWAYVISRSDMSGLVFIVVPVCNLLLLAPIGAAMGWWIGRRTEVTR